MAIFVSLAAPTAPAHGDDAVVPILGWRTLSENELTPERFQEMKEMGLTHSLMGYSPEGNAKALDLGQRVGIKLFISDGRFAEGGDALRQAVQSYREHPALAGYNLRDEPSLSAFAQLTKTRRALSQVDPLHWSYVNLLPTYAVPQQWGTPTYLEHVRRFVAEFEPEVLSFDHYPIMKGYALRADYFQNLEWIRLAAQEKGIPFWAFALTCPHHPYAEPTEGTIRFQAWCNFAYGSKGLQYFTYWTPTPGTWDFHDAPIKVDGTRSPLYDLLRKFNAEVQQAAPILTRSRVTQVYHTEPIPAGGRPLDASAPLRNLTGGQAVLSVHDLPDGRRFAQMVNRSFRDAATLRFNLNDWVQGVEPFLPSTELIRRDDDLLQVTLPAGACVFLELKTS